MPPRLLCKARIPFVFPGTRCLATPASSKPTFAQALSSGPSLDDFISNDQPQRVVLGNTSAPRLPAHLKTSIPSGASYNAIKKDLRGLGLHTVCEEARCPNISDCWGGKDASGAVDKQRATATIMVCKLRLAHINGILMSVSLTSLWATHVQEVVGSALSRPRVLQRRWTHMNQRIRRKP
jgi:hypothetical protein